MRTLTIGDIHGAHKALMQCLQRSQFDYDNDILICLGDVCDGWYETQECIDELLKIKNLVMVIGNHDSWALDWMKYGDTPPIWTEQGGKATMQSYGFMRTAVPNEHIELFENAYPYVESKDKTKLFVHGGFDCMKNVDVQNPDILMWDRRLVCTAFKKRLQGNEKKLGSYDEIYVGHSTTQRWAEILSNQNGTTYEQELVPMKACNVWMLDQGGGWSGKLSIMDVDSKEYWQSDFVSTLYPHVKGRENSIK